MGFFHVYGDININGHVIMIPTFMNHSLWVDLKSRFNYHAVKTFIVRPCSQILETYWILFLREYIYEIILLACMYMCVTR